MDEKELESLVAQLKAQGLGEEEILDTYYEAFEKGEMDRKDLEALANHLGYELDDDFKNDEHPDPIEEKGAEDKGAEGEVTKEEAEDLKAIEPGESKEEFEEKVEEAKEGEPEEKPAEEEEPAEEEKSEEEEWEEANKYFRA